MFRPGFHRVLEPSERSKCTRGFQRVCIPTECSQCGRVSPITAPKDDSHMSQEIDKILHRSRMRSKLHWNTRRPNKDQTETISEIERLVDAPIDWRYIDKLSWAGRLQSIEQNVVKHAETDTTIIIGEAVIECYSPILQCYTDFFKDRDFGETWKLPEDQVSPEIFRLIYRWMKESNDNAMYLLTRRNVLSVLLAAQYLQIQSLIEQCWAFIDSPAVFNEETALLLFTDERIRQFLSVRDMMLSRISRSFLPFTKTIQFVKLPKDNLCLLLNSNYLMLHVEMEVFMAACRWLLYDWRERESDLMSVMRCVRFGLMPAWLLSAIRSDQSNPKLHAALGDRQVNTLISDALAYNEYRISCGQPAPDWAKKLGLEEPKNRRCLIALTDEEECALNNSLWDQYIIEQKEWAGGKGDDRSAFKKRRSKRRPIQ